MEHAEERREEERRALAQELHGVLSCGREVRLAVSISLVSFLLVCPVLSCSS